MLHFHVAIYGRPAATSSGPQAELLGISAATRVLAPQTPPEPLPVTFEDAEAALTRLSRLFFEPDGSFGWFAEPGAPRWEIGGMLYDRGDRVMYAELNGACPAAAMRDLLGALGHSQAPLVVQVLNRAIFVEPEEFCRVLAAVNG